MKKKITHKTVARINKKARGCCFAIRIRFDPSKSEFTVRFLDDSRGMSSDKVRPGELASEL